MPELPSPRTAPGLNCRLIKCSSAELPLATQCRGSIRPQKGPGVRRCLFRTARLCGAGLPSKNHTRIPPAPPSLRPSCRSFPYLIIAEIPDWDAPLYPPLHPPIYPPIYPLNCSVFAAGHANEARLLRLTKYIFDFRPPTLFVDCGHNLMK